MEDAAAATVASLKCAPGIYNICDDDPSQLSVWLPAFAAAVGAPEPARINEEEARQIADPDSVYYATQCAALPTQRQSASSVSLQGEWNGWRGREFDGNPGTRFERVGGGGEW